jgi:hypothetical protein
MKNYLRYGPMAVAAFTISGFFVFGVMCCFPKLPISLAALLAVPVFAICMNGLDKPFRDLPGNR